VGIQSETSQYYNGDLFHELWLLVAHGEVPLEKLLFVYNKVDLLRNHLPSAKDAELLDVCHRKFEKTCEPLRRIVSGAKICELLTVLERGETGYKSHGADRVKGEAARPLVKAFNQLDVGPPDHDDF